MASSYTTLRERIRSDPSKSASQSKQLALGTQKRNHIDPVRKTRSRDWRDLAMAFFGTTSTLIITTLVSLLLGIGIGLYWMSKKRSNADDRIAQMIEIIDEHRSDGQFAFEISPDADDMLGRLAQELNRLGQAYRRILRHQAQQAEEMAMLNFVAEIVNRTLDLQEVFDTSLREALRAVDWDMGAIYMWDERIRTLNMVSYVGLSEVFVRHAFSYQLGESMTGRAAKDRKRIIVEDLGATEDFNGIDEGARPATIISIPLVALPGELVGVLNVANSSSDVLTSHELDILNTVAHQIAIAIDKAQLYTQATMRAEELESIVEARTEQLATAIAELSQALEKAREADKLKSLFLSMVSHELRTPLATIKGNSSLLVEHFDQLDPLALRDHLDDINTETDKLTEMISDLLELSRIESGMLHIEPQPVNLIDVVRSSVDSARVRLKAHEITFEAPQELPLCVGDALRIEQIMANLLENAARYSEEGTRIAVTVKLAEDYIVSTVSDEGQGIEPDHIGHIFDRFYQIKQSSDAGRKGIGLGLAICKGLAEAHRGKIWVESTPGQGSAFSFSIPVANLEMITGREFDG